MHVRTLKLTDFRNIGSLRAEFGGGLNILVGENAQGKTSILEALVLLSTTRSMRAVRESDMIARGSEAGHVLGEIEREVEGETELHVTVLQGEKKAVRINGSKRGRVLDLLGQFNAVFFGAIDLEIITGEPSARRHYLNSEISQISPRYIFSLAHYKRALEQRNRLLKDLRESGRPHRESGLSEWSEQLVTHGAPIFARRAFWISRLAPLADGAHQFLTDGRERLIVQYAPSVAWQAAAEGAEENTDTSRQETLARIEKAFRERLASAASDELRRGTTLAGPQRDDLTFHINEMEARIYGSQGQQRTVALALKLAEFQLIHDLVGEPPVMLLDDVMSDLDDHRRAHLIEWLQRRCQAFITCTSLRAFPAAVLREARAWEVRGGVLSELSPEAGTAEEEPTRA